jgi:hypothetical protein
MDMDGLKDIGRRMISRGDQVEGDDTLWSAASKTLTGVGGGRYRLTFEFLYFESGLLTTKSQQIRTIEIYDADASQSITQKARGVGTITLWAAREGGNREKVTLEDLPNFREGVAIINETAHAAREALRARENTQFVNYSGVPAAQQPFTPAAVPAPAMPAQDENDVHAQIVKLGNLRDQGLLTEDEFVAAKKKLLGL